jgi:hypothetical protein
MTTTATYKVFFIGPPSGASVRIHTDIRAPGGSGFDG